MLLVRRSGGTGIREGRPPRSLRQQKKKKDSRAWHFVLRIASGLLTVFRSASGLRRKSFRGWTPCAQRASKRRATVAAPTTVAVPSSCVGHRTTSVRRSRPLQRKNMYIGDGCAQYLDVVHHNSNGGPKALRQDMESRCRQYAPMYEKWRCIRALKHNGWQL